MCLGVPYEVISSNFLTAQARSGYDVATIDMSLVGEQPAGTHILVFLGAAREVISPERAAQVADALEAVRLVMTGAGTANIDHLFADLINREPQIPEHLLPDTHDTGKAQP